MDRKTIIDRYSHYNDILQKLGSYPLSEDVTIMGKKNALNPTRGVIQSVYKEKGKYKFEGNLVEYLCWISTLYILDLAKISIPKDKPTEYAKFIITKYESFPTDVKNLLRLFPKNPSYFFDILHGGKREFNKDDKNCYKALAGFCFVFYNAENGSPDSYAEKFQEEYADIKDSINSIS